MRLLVGGDGGVRVVDIAIERRGATLADLAEALGFDRDTALVIDGVPCEWDDPIDALPLVDGAAVHRRDEPFAGSSSGLGSFWVGVTNGPSTGVLHRVASGAAMTFGRDASNDLVIENTSVSAHHGRIMVRADGIVVEDCGSRNGTWLGDSCVTEPVRIEPGQPIRAGSSTITIHDVDMEDRTPTTAARNADPTGHILLNRPPRAAVPTTPEPIELPEGFETPRGPKLSLAPLAVPVLFAGAMVLALGSWRYALFGLLAPAMAIANWLAGRRQSRRSSKRNAALGGEALTELDAQLDEVLLTERARRQAIAPDVVEIRRRIELPTRELWERRPQAFDGFTVRVGVGECSWVVPTLSVGPEVAPSALQAVERAQKLTSVEILVKLSDGHVGVVGDGEASAAVARAIVVQLATHHGPADLELVVVSRTRSSAWDWTRWLPHAGDATTGESRVFDADGADEMARAFFERYGTEGPGQRTGHLLLVVDDPAAFRGRSSPLRRLLGEIDGVIAIILAPTVDELPASVSSIIHVDEEDGRIRVHRPAEAELGARGVGDLLELGAATDLARSMARFGDPERRTDTGLLPVVVKACDLPGGMPSTEVMSAMWSMERLGNSLSVAMGVGPAGPMEIDLVADGPHALVAGTTGSGKSEFLRSLIVGLAIGHSPRDVVFVLIDYKGGSAFDRCAELPHVVGVVTDLDEHLAERALQSLEAELRLREERLRACAASDIDGYRAEGSPLGTLPRLVVVIDEFATLRAELPDFMASLVSIAQRGRSLGVHLVLATQRPSGAVDANIRANTNLRVALRVQTSSESMDIVDTPVAVDISRDHPGRAFVRRGHHDLVAVQTLYLAGADIDGQAVIRVHPDPETLRQTRAHARRHATTVTADVPTELSVLVDRVRAVDPGGSEPRRPWLDVLPEHVTPNDLVELDDNRLEADNGGDALADDGLIVALGDLPASQKRVACRWAPRDEHLGVVGIRNSGVSTTLRNVVAALHESRGSGSWVFAADHAGGGLAGIENWPHVSCRLEPTEVERHRRLLTMLERELDDRQARGTSDADDQPVVVLVIDGVAGFNDVIGASTDPRTADRLARIVRDGPAHGMTLVLGAARPGDIPRALRSRLGPMIVHEQSDREDYMALGVHKKSVPTFTPGRALFGHDSIVAQVVDWESSLDIDRPPTSPPPRVEEIPVHLDEAHLPPADVGHALTIPVGLDLTTHEALALQVRPGEHVTISGPAGSGRTNTLLLMAAKLRASDRDLVLVGVVPAGSAGRLDGLGIDATGTLDEIEHVVQMARDDERRWVILVDDADRIEDERGPLAELARSAPPHVTLIATLRSSSARTTYGHWTRFVRSSGTGLLLMPDVAVDGDVLGTRLPRDATIEQTVGRGYCVLGHDVRPVQVAHVSPPQQRP